MLHLLAAVLITISAAGDAAKDGNDDVVDGFKKNSVNVASCEDSNAGSSGSYW